MPSYFLGRRRTTGLEQYRKAMFEHLLKLQAGDGMVALWGRFTRRRPILNFATDAARSLFINAEQRTTDFVINPERETRCRKLTIQRP